MSSGALDGIVIADFSRVLAGPYATMLLGDLGAEVIKIERPGSGDDTRAWGPPFDADGTATYFNAVNRNKKSVVLDLSTDEGRAEALRLVERADVVVENFRAGTMERLGLGYDQVRPHNPAVIYCAITGFGSGPGAGLPGYDLIVQAVGGLMSMTGPEPGAPTKVGVAVVDVLTALHASVGILAALRHREHTGEGQRVDVNLLGSLLSSLVNQASAYLGAGAVGSIMGNRHPSIVPYEVFPTADRPVALAVGNDKQFAALCAELDLPDTAVDPRFRTNSDRVRHRDELYSIVSQALSVHDADHWFRVLTAVGVPIGPINDIEAAFEFAENLGIGARVSVPDSATPQVANPIGMSVTPPQYRSAPPRLGADQQDTQRWAV